MVGELEPFPPKENPLPPLWGKAGMGGDAALRPKHLALCRARAAPSALPPIQLRLSSLCSLRLRNLPPQGGKGIQIAGALRLYSAIFV
jgi:hypothetical protein